MRINVRLTAQNCSDRTHVHRALLIRDMRWIGSDWHGQLSCQKSFKTLCPCASFRTPHRKHASRMTCQTVQHHQLQPRPHPSPLPKAASCRCTALRLRTASDDNGICVSHCSNADCKRIRSPVRPQREAMGPGSTYTGSDINLWIVAPYLHRGSSPGLAEEPL